MSDDSYSQLWDQLDRAAALPADGPYVWSHDTAKPIISEVLDALTEENERLRADQERRIDVATLRDIYESVDSLSKSVRRALDTAVLQHDINKRAIEAQATAEAEVAALRTRLDTAEQLLDLTVMWAGAEDWKGPQLPVELAGAIARFCEAKR